MIYTAIIRKLYQLGDAPQGYPGDELSQAAERLDIRLPEVLRNYYTDLGKNIAVNAHHNRLLAPEDMYVTASGYLVFYEENQGVAVWGISCDRLHEAHPPVCGSYDAEQEEWWEDSDSPEHFLLSMAYWNAALGGLRHMAMSEQVSPDIITMIEPRWPEHKGITNQYLRFFTSDHSDILTVTTDAEGLATGLYIASDDPEKYTQIVEGLDISWDYRSDRDHYSIH